MRPWSGRYRAPVATSSSGSPASAPIDLPGLFDVRDRVAIVTGASSGFGDRFVRVLSEAGVKVIACARRLDRLEALAAEVPNVVPVRADVARDEDLAAVVAAAVQRFGRIDIVVNNAGLSDAPERAEDEDPAAFRAVMEVNLNACFVLSSYAAKHMIGGGGGSIVNIASVHSFVGSSPNNQASYVASKHGLIGLTKELALQWCRHGIRVNAIAPGYFATELTEEMFSGEARGQAWIERNTPMRRAGDIAELDGALLFLASDASRYVIGQTVVVDGGWTIR